MRIVSVAFFFCAMLSPLMAQESIALFIPSPFHRHAIEKALWAHDYQTHAYQTSDNIQTFFAHKRPDVVVVDASGLDSIDEMLIYELQVLQVARRLNVKKCLLLSNSSIYPKNAPLPLQENTLASTNIKTVSDPYALAKLTSFAACHEENSDRLPHFYMGVYAEVYGPHDTRCVPKNTQPLYQAIDRIVWAKQKNDAFTVIANDGKAQYDLLYIDDFAEGVYRLIRATLDQEIYNIGTGRDQKMSDIVENLHAISGFKGSVVLDQNCYDSVPRRLVDPKSLYALGWHPATSVQEGVRKTFSWYEDTLTKP
jgi:GDP-L-fucose synthase